MYEEFNTITFKVPDGRPAQPQGMTITNASESDRPTFVWEAADNVTWYQLWLGNNSAEYHFQDWTFAADFGCVENSSCTFELPATMTSGQSSLPDGTYEVWINSWGPGGFAQNPDDVSQGWMRVLEFTVDGA